MFPRLMTRNDLTSFFSFMLDYSRACCVLLGVG